MTATHDIPLEERVADLEFAFKAAVEAHQQEIARRIWFERQMWHAFSELLAGTRRAEAHAAQIVWADQIQSAGEGGPAFPPSPGRYSRED